MNKKSEELLNGYRSWLEWKNFKPRGMEGKLRNARYFLEYLEENRMEVCGVGLKDAENYRETLAGAVGRDGRSRFNPATINIGISELSLFYRYLASSGLAARNPFAHVERIRESHRLPKNILSVQDMEKLLKGIRVESSDDFKFRVALEVLYSTACRINEIEGLRKRDIDTERGVITILDDKDRRDRIAPLTEYAARILELYLKSFSPDDRPFLHGKKRTLNQMVNVRLKRICVELGIPPVTCHCIRHTVASQMLSKGADLREVQEILGHRRIRNTEVYTRLSADDLKKVIDEKHPRERGA